ncbi:aldo/keto reductase [Kitasatospora sp. NPDC056783]|uniref:aldo/keto reductase n=1 Tax=Kitasatospora sp. NPDC056783 TaxID=3345943 RepID=UPI00367D223C
MGTRALGGPAVIDGVPVGSGEVACDKAVAALHRAWDLGVRWFDTCDAYGLGRAERFIGRFRADLGTEAAELRLSARLGVYRGTASHPLRAVHMRHQLEQLAENTGVEELDLVALADVGAAPGNEGSQEAVEAMLSLRDTGWARRIGIPVPAAGDRGDASARHARFLALHEQLRPEVLQVAMVDLSPLTVIGDESLFEFAERTDCEVLVHGPLVYGLLTGLHPAGSPSVFDAGDLRSRHPWFRPAARRVVDGHLAVLREHFGAEPVQLVRAALRYCLQVSARTTVLVGVGSAGQAGETLEAAERPLSHDEFTLAGEVFAALRADLAALGA